MDTFHLTPLAGRRVGRRGQSLLALPRVSRGRGPSAVALPPLGCAGAGGSEVLLPFGLRPPLTEHPSPREAPHPQTGPCRNQAPSTPGADHPSLTCHGEGVGCQLCGRPSSPKDSSQPWTPRAPPNTVWESQAAAGARAARGEDLPPGTQEPATATPETRGSTQTLRLTPGDLPSLPLGDDSRDPRPSPKPGLV